MQDAHDEAKQALVTYLGVIHGRMEALVAVYVKACMEVEDKDTSWSNRSILRLGSHKAGNHLQVKWYTMKWYGKGSTRRSIKGVIRKSPNEDTYSLAQLKEVAKEWEWPLVEKTEMQLGMLRRQAGFVVKALTSLRYAQMAMDKRNDAFPQEE